MWGPSDDPLHPLNTMVHGDGSEQAIPVVVAAIVAFGFVLSALIVNTNPWKTSELGVGEIPSKALSESSSGSPSVLLLFRLYTALHMSYITFTLWDYRGATMFFFYTNWTYVLETVFFILAAGFSTLRLIVKPKGRVQTVGSAMISLLHVVLVAALVVDILHWGVLWPILSKTQDKAILAHHTAMTFSWSSYNTHGLNLAFILIELLLNMIPYQPHLVGFTGFFTSLYGLWAFTIHHNTGRWVYPFLNATKPWAPAVYAGIFVGHLVFFGCATLLFRLKDKLVGTKLATNEAISSLLDEEESIRKNA